MINKIAVIASLRKRTSSGILDCKEALEACDYNEEKAIEYLRIKGKTKAVKFSDRVAEEGIVCSVISDDSRKGILLEVNCETDFVARTTEFRNLVKHFAEYMLSNGVVDNYINELILQHEVGFGEKLCIGRYEIFEIE